MWKIHIYLHMSIWSFCGKNKKKNMRLGTIIKELTSTNVFLIIEIFLKIHITLYMDKLSQIHLSILVQHNLDSTSSKVR